MVVSVYWGVSCKGGSYIKSCESHGVPKHEETLLI